MVLGLCIADGMCEEFWKIFTNSVIRIANRKIQKTKSIIQPSITITKREKVLAIPDRYVEVVKMTKQEKRKFISAKILDLHGCTTETLFDKLQAFCEKSIQNGIQNVTIITGKGQNIIRSKTEKWLLYSSKYIISYDEKKDKYNQSGAFIVRLRKI